MTAPPAAVPWIPPVLYAAVLAGGLYHTAVSDGPVHPGRTAGFVAGLLLLLALEAFERRHRPSGTANGTGPAAVLLLAARLVLFAGVAALDGSGVSRALFLLVPFTARLALGPRAGLVSGAGCVALLIGGYTVSVPRWWLRAEYVSDLLMLGLGLALALSMASVAVREQRGRTELAGVLAELEGAHERLSRYALRVAELSAADERNRVAREIHDSLGHHLTAIGIQLEKAEVFRDRDPEVAARAVADARWSAGRALTEVRESVGALRGARPFSLNRALADLTRRLGDDRLTVTLRITGDEAGYDAGSLTALYRSAQEALTNACRHGRATRIDVTAALGESAARLTVADNGRGFTTAPPSPSARRPGSGLGSGSGLHGMRERVELLGGRVDIDGRPASGASPGGAVVTVIIPRERPAPGSAG
ncbi:sensor histidine kinase [Streptomyces sp. NPDC057638]|uniref:sensor histidine kinase n=1 Tax=Streptomyces sp. NPDC057638 TaxID=3346190 RepID=UPI00367F772E